MERWVRCLVLRRPARNRMRRCLYRSSRVASDRRIRRRHTRDRQPPHYPGRGPATSMVRCQPCEHRVTGPRLCSRPRSVAGLRRWRQRRSGTHYLVATLARHDGDRPPLATSIAPATRANRSMPRVRGGRRGSDHRPGPRPRASRGCLGLVLCLSANGTEAASPGLPGRRQKKACRSGP